MIEGKYLYIYDNLEDVSFIRKEVFHIDDIINETKSIDVYSQKELYTVVYDNKKPIATGTLICKDETYYMEKVGVLEEERGKGYGDFVVRLIIDKAFLLGTSEINTICALKDVKFFEKLGFQAESIKTEIDGVMYINMKLKKECVKKCCNKM